MEGYPYQLFINLPFGETMAEQTGTGYGDAFIVKARNTVMIEKTNIVTFDPGTWLNVFKKTEYKAKLKTDYLLEKNIESKMDWDSDKYTKSLSEIIDSKKEIDITVVEDNSKGKPGLLEDYGGGFTESPSEIVLSNKLSQYNDKGVASKFSKKWSLGMVALHELLIIFTLMGKQKITILIK